MSVVDSPFSPTSLFAEAQAEAEAHLAPVAPTGAGEHFSPFREAFGSDSEAEAETEALDHLLAELESEEFAEAVEALTHRAGAFHASSTAAWSHGSESEALASSEVEQWLESIAAEADQRFAELQERFGDRTVESLSEAELAELESEGIDSQEAFIGGLFKKVASVARGVGSLIKKGVQAVSRLLPVGKLFGLLKKLVRPLLKRVLQSAIGRLPTALRPAARSLAARFGFEAEGVVEGTEAETEAEGVAAEFDQRLAEALAAPDDRFDEAFSSEDEQLTSTEHHHDPVAELDAARVRLREQLAAAEAGTDPTAEMEQFIPAVMAVMPLIKMGVKIIGRPKVVGFVGQLLAQLIRPMVGPQLAPMLSQHIASAGMSMIGLEAESRDPSLGAEALVSIAEDTIREVASLQPESLENELLLEAVVREAFTAAAARHLPDRFLRPEVVEERRDGGDGIWVLMPRGRTTHRYRKYTRAVPLVVTRPLARGILLRSGETLEDRLLESGAASFPVSAELELFETLPGTSLGHLAAAEGEGAPADEVALEFEQLDEVAGKLPVALPPALRTAAARRYFRLRIPGVRVRRRSIFSLRLDLSAPSPKLRLDIRIGERAAHLLAARLQQRQIVPVVAELRRFLEGPLRVALMARLRLVFLRRSLPVAPGRDAALAGQLIAHTVRTVAQELPTAAPKLLAAAKDPAPGVTVRLTFGFASREALLRGEPQSTALEFAPGWRRG